VPDVAVVGGGAAGLATAIFTKRRHPDRAVVVLDGARRLGAKILVSGGGRCNVTNSVVGAADFWQARSPFVRRVLRSFGVEQTVAFFREIGVSLHEEAGGKLFPDSHKARTVLAALLAEAERRGVEVCCGHRVAAVARGSGGFSLETSAGVLDASRVVLATGGRSLPKTGSDGGGYAVAQGLGHSLVSTTPALAPLLLEGGFHVPLSGVSHDVEITVRVEGSKPVRIAGALLWTHFGASGPAAMNASRFVERARLEALAFQVTLSLLPGDDFEKTDAWLLALAADKPNLGLLKALAARLPASVASAILAELSLGAAAPLGRLRREDRRRLVKALLEAPLRVVASRGYNFAEATSGGVPLAEVDAATMESRRCAGLHLVGEILDVDGRIGGFNFQWAWSSAWVAARGLWAGRTI
jgi:predicted Rossmann fold flavoprotein